MKAAVLEDIKKLIVKDIEKPEACDDMALVRVKACGICMTDYKAYSGERKNVDFPTICGHEFSGVIEDVGVLLGVTVFVGVCELVGVIDAVGVFVGVCEGHTP